MACAKSYHGPWTVLGNPHPTDRTGTSFHSQISSVFKHPHKRDLYIALADRWLPQLPPTIPNVMEEYARHFSDVAEETSAFLAQFPEYPDTSLADYVWLPVRFDNDMAYLDWQDEWRIEDFA